MSTPVVELTRAAKGSARVRRRIVVSGVVQGVGFRPFVYVTATELGLVGSVANDSDGVIIEAEGNEGDVAELIRRLGTDAPPLARVDGIVVTDISDTGESGFSIPRIESQWVGSHACLT